MVLREKFLAKNNCMSFSNLSMSFVSLVSEKLHYCYNDLHKQIELWTQALPVPSPFASPWSQPFCGWSMDLGINSCLSQWVYRLIDDFSWSLLGLMTSTCIVFCFSGPSALTLALEFIGVWWTIIVDIRQKIVWFGIQLLNCSMHTVNFLASSNLLC